MGDMQFDGTQEEWDALVKKNKSKSMTAVDWLITELNQELNYIPITQWDRIRDLIKRAKQMERKQIIDAFDEGQEYEYQYHINNAPKFYSETYFAETYGSKGSDERIVDTNKTIISQTEISDDEIKAFAMGYYDNNGADYYVELGAKWYREQLKSK